MEFVCCLHTTTAFSHSHRLRDVIKLPQLCLSEVMELYYGLNCRLYA